MVLHQLLLHRLHVLPQSPLEPMPSSLFMQHRMVRLHTAALAARRCTARLLQHSACNMLAMLQANLACVSLRQLGPSLWHCHGAENQAVGPIMPVSVPAPLHSALEGSGLLTAPAVLAALTQMLGLDSYLPSTILIILAGLDVVTFSTRTSLNVGPSRRYLGQLRILAASTAGRLRSG
jgi:hypothetical protein